MNESNRSTERSGNGGVSTMIIILVLVGIVAVSSIFLFWDCDDDGLRNYREWFQTNTDYLDEDTDGDGLKDGEEVEMGTDPLQEDAPNPDLGGPYSTDEVHNHIEESRTIVLKGKESTAPSGTIEEYSWEIVDDPTGSAYLTSSDSVSSVFHSPNDVESGSEVTIKLTITGGSGLSANDTTTVTVRPYNEPPEINPQTPEIPNPTVEEPNDRTFSVTATDEEDSNLDYTWSGDVSGSGSQITYEGSWDPDHQDEQLDVNVEVMDSGGKSQSESWNLTVQDVNRSPEISLGGPYSVDEDHGLNHKSATLDRNDFSDPEGDSLSYDWRILDDTFASLSKSDSSTPKFGSVPEVSNLKNIEVEVRVRDGYGGESRETVTVEINPYQEISHKFVPTLVFEDHESYYPCNPCFDEDYNSSNNKSNYGEELPWIYIHKLSYRGKTYIQYWIYYVYNTYPIYPDHMHDWEFLEVVLTDSNDVEKVRYGAHGNVHDYSAGEVLWEDGTHPVAYVAGDTHAMDHDKGGIAGTVGTDTFGQVGEVIHWNTFKKYHTLLGEELGSREINGYSVTKVESNGYREWNGIRIIRDGFWPTDYGGYDGGTGPAPWNRDIWSYPTLDSYG